MSFIMYVKFFASIFRTDKLHKSVKWVDNCLRGHWPPLRHPDLKQMQNCPVWIPCTWWLGGQKAKYASLWSYLGFEKNDFRKYKTAFSKTCTLSVSLDINHSPTYFQLYIIFQRKVMAYGHVKSIEIALQDEILSFLVILQALTFAKK